MWISMHCHISWQIFESRSLANFWKLSESSSLEEVWQIGKVDSDVRLNAMLLDVWEANANQEICILIRLSKYSIVFSDGYNKKCDPLII